jgi:hypothetical protein
MPKARLISQAYTRHAYQSYHIATTQARRKVWARLPSHEHHCTPDPKTSDTATKYPQFTEDHLVSPSLKPTEVPCGTPAHVRNSYTILSNLCIVFITSSALSTTDTTHPISYPHKPRFIALKIQLESAPIPLSSANNIHFHPVPSSHRSHNQSQSIHVWPDLTLPRAGRLLKRKYCCGMGEEWTEYFCTRLCVLDT